LSNSGSFSFTGYGVEISLIENPGVKAVDEGKLIFLDNLYSTPMYKLENPLLVKGNTDSFYIRYKSEVETTLELSFENKITLEILLPGSDGILQYQVVVFDGDLISGFRVKSVYPDKENKSFQIIDVGIEKTIPGFIIRTIDNSSVTVIPQGFKILNSNTYLFEELSGRASSQFDQVRISLSYDYSGSEEMDLDLVIFSENNSKSFGLNPRHQGAVVSFYSTSLGFIPTGLTIKNNDPDFSITSIDITPFSKLASINYNPVYADIGTMLNYKKEAWRRSDWELFSWNLFPDILVMDFRDYSLQSSFLKRLTFFVEKSGFSGTLQSNETLSSLHGWNAHDYRAKDLAAFFTKAEEESFILNPEEIELKSILISNRIIKKTESGYDPVSGGILSYSMESSPRLRRLFITHEGYHGIFFSDLEFVAEVQSIWDGLDYSEKQFWYDFLAWKQYDIENSYLVVNEFMAYLMQQRIEDIESYYKDYIIPKYLVAFPDDIDKMSEFLLNYPNHFLDNAKKVEAAAYRLNSISAGELRCLY